MRFFKLKESYLLFLIVIGLVSLAVYTTFALFTANTEIENVVNFDTTLNLGVRMFEYEMITLQPGETKIIEVNVTNDYASSLYYGAWYEVITPSDASNIDIGLYTEKNSTPGSGQMESNTSLSLIVGIANYGSEEAIVNIGVAGSEDNSLNLKDGRTLIPSGWSEPILVTAEVLEENTTTITETNTTTNPVNLTYTTSGKTTLSLNPGTYKLEVWGAQGGSFNTTYVGGKGGYSYGTLTLTAKTNAYVYVGGQGTNGTSSGTYAGGYNGGGQAYTASATYDMSAGGGASDIRLGSDSLYARVIVAGGGGGAGTYSSSYRYSGGAGGGTSGTAGGQYTTTYKGGLGGSSTSAGTSYYGTTTNSTTYGTLAGFGVGGSANTTSTSYYIAGGGGGWYGGGYARRAAGGGGSGYVYTSSTASQCPSGCLLNSSYYLTSAATIAGNTSTNFNNVAGTGTETGHAGDGAAKITGTETITTQTQKTVYTIPRVSGLSDKSVTLGKSIDLMEGVTLECGHEIDCSFLSVSVNDTSKLEVGTYTVNYVVEDENKIRYKFERLLKVREQSAADLIFTNLSSGLPSTSAYDVNPNCTGATSSFDYVNKKILISNVSVESEAICSPVITQTTRKSFANYIINLLNGQNSVSSTAISGNGSTLEKITDNSALDYRYRGQDPANYVIFNDELWRIVGVFDQNSHGISNTNLVKIIRNDLLGTFIYDADYDNNFPTSDMYQMLNSIYYNSTNGNENTYCATLESCDFTGLGLKTAYKNMVETNVNWFLGGHSTEDVVSSVLYASERSTTKPYDTSNISTKEAGLTTPIGLIYASDYGYASPTSCASNLSLYDTNGCADKNWLKSNDYEWTLTVSSAYSLPYFVFGIGETGAAVRPRVDSDRGYRPTLYLKSDVYYVSGDGTQTNPYIIAS